MVGLKSGLMCSSIQLLLLLLFFEIPSAEQIPANNEEIHVLQVNSSISTGFIHIQNGDQIDLSSYPDYSFEVKLSNSTIPIPAGESTTRALFKNVDIRFTVRPPENHGIIMVIQEMQLHRPSSRSTGTIRLHCKLDYIKLSEIDGNKQSGPICGTLPNKTGRPVMRGPRNFMTGVNKGIGVHFFTAGYSNTKNNVVMEGQSDEEDVTQTENEVVLVFTAYSECPSGKPGRRCESDKNRCISPNLFCNGKSNCAIESSSDSQGVDELGCSKPTEPEPKDDLETNTDSRSIFSVISSVTESISSTTPPSVNPTNRTTLFPWWIVFPPKTPKPSTERPSYNYNWNWTPAPPTTRKTIIIVPNYDYDPEPSGPNWARRIPPFQVVLIFVTVVFLIFGTCTLLARINTAKPLIFNGPQQSVPRSRLSDRIQAPNPESLPPEDVVIMNQMADLNFPNPHAQSPPPRYHEVNEPPPSYNTLFNKK